jgi:CRP-like cAMP-binding protein
VQKGGNVRFSSDKIRRLEGVSLFGDCSRRQLRRIAPLVEEVSVEAGTVLCDEGQIARDVFIVVDGTADVVRHRRLVDSLGPGDVFGDVSFIDRGPRAATVTATSDMRVFMLDARRFSTLLDVAPTVGSTLARAMCARLRKSALRRRPARRTS